MVWEIIYVSGYLTINDFLDIAYELTIAGAEWEGCELLPEETDFCMN